MNEQPIPKPMARFVLLLVLFLIFSGTLACLAEKIPLTMSGGVYTVPVQLNGVVTVNFVVDSGAAEVCIPADVASTLARSGTIKASDYLPDAIGITADGSRVPSHRFVLRSLKIGSVTLHDVPASILPSSRAEPLLGQSALQRMGHWYLDTQVGVLRLGETGSARNSGESADDRPVYSGTDWARNGLRGRVKRVSETRHEGDDGYDTTCSVQDYDSKGYRTMRYTRRDFHGVIEERKETTSNQGTLVNVYDRSRGESWTLLFTYHLQFDAHGRLVRNDTLASDGTTWKTTVDWKDSQHRTRVDGPPGGGPGGMSTEEVLDQNGDLVTKRWYSSTCGSTYCFETNYIHSNLDACGNWQAATELSVNYEVGHTPPRLTTTATIRRDLIYY